MECASESHARGLRFFALSLSLDELDEQFRSHPVHLSLSLSLFQLTVCCSGYGIQETGTDGGVDNDFEEGIEGTSLAKDEYERLNKLLEGMQDGDEGPLLWPCFPYLDRTFLLPLRIEKNISG